MDPKADIDSNDFFDFSTNKAITIDLQLGVTGETLFYFYAEDPTILVDNSWIINEEIFPFYADVTDVDGNFSQSILLPAFVTKVWLVAEHVYLPLTIELDVVDGLMIYQSAGGQVSGARLDVQGRALMNGVTYPDGYDTLGEWDSEGYPQYLLEKQIIIPNAFLKRCNDLHNAISMNYNSHDNVNSFWNLNKTDLETTGTNDMVITKNTKLIASYFSGNSAWNNMVAYYTYQEGETVTLSDMNSLKKTILFPRYSRTAPSNLPGKQVQLKYWNKETGKYQEEFPAGTHIGWILLGDAFGRTSTSWTRYSNPAFSSNGRQYSILMQDSELDNCFFMAIEDNVDFRFNDVMFSIISTENESIEGLPIIPDPVDREDISYRVLGTLAFEDFWPQKGDYDMNDVVVNFTSTFSKKRSSGRVTRTTTTFTPVNDGATFVNGFGIQLDHVTANQVESLSVSQEGTILSTSFETGTDKPVVILFDNMKTVINKPITVDIVYRSYGSAVVESEVQPPYNPFIFAQDRSHEIHLTGYQPTSKADDTLRGSEDDLREDKYGNPMYYVATDNMPFALYLNGIIFDYPSEREDIRVKYPRFDNWVKSFGAEDTDWYKAN
ncbi:MAG: LruC domain-containing protein [Phocaeicola sp.]